ncbi:MAG: chemotaxis protein CheC [Thermotaleaceae bacterium]
MGITLDQLNSMQLDVLKEIGNIGAGNAATALAEMINKKIDMNVPKVQILEFKEVPELIGGAETVVCGIYFRVEGDLDGHIMFLLALKSSKLLTNMLMSKSDEAETLDEIEQSAIQEIGNILSGSYVSSLSALTNLNMKISIPSLAIDMAGAILSVPVIQYGHVGDKVLLIETELMEGNNEVKGFFFLIPDVDSFETLLSSLGVLQ